MPTDMLAALTVFAFVASATPGPNNLMLLSSGVNFGFQRTIPHMLGVAVGFTFMIIAVGLGISQVFAAEPRLYIVLKWLSTVYMLWLAWKIANSGPVSTKTVAGSIPLTFFQAAMFQWINPKAWAMALTGAAAYTVPSNYLGSLLIMALVFGLINLPTITCWAAFGVGLRSSLQDPAKVRIFNWTMALLLVASLIPVFLELR